MAREIVWNKRASRFLAQVLKRISIDSMLQAERVEATILSSIQKLNPNPSIHPPDKFKKNNLGHFRAFEKMSLRIAYKVTDNQIRILRIRHVKQEPKAH